MQKVSCENGHFYDADRFQACPICGATNHTVVSQTPVVSAEKLPTTEPLFHPQDGLDVSEATRPVDRLPRTEKLLPEDESHLREAVEREQGQGLETGVDTTERTDSPFSSEDIGVEPSKAIGPAPSTDPTPSLSAAIQATSAQGISPLPKTMAYYDFNKIIPPVAWLVCVKGSYVGEAFECHTGRNRLGREKGMEICLYKDRSISRDTHAIIIYEPKRRQFFLQPGSGDGLVYLNDALVFSHEELHAYDKISIGKLEFVFLSLCGEKFTWDDYIAKE